LPDPYDWLRTPVSNKRRKFESTIRGFFEIHRGPSAEFDFVKQLPLKTIDYELLREMISFRARRLMELRRAHRSLIKLPAVTA
jgi:hypothetical protein